MQPDNLLNEQAGEIAVKSAIQAANLASNIHIDSMESTNNAPQNLNGHKAGNNKRIRRSNSSDKLYNLESSR